MGLLKFWRSPQRAASKSLARKIAGNVAPPARKLAVENLESRHLLVADPVLAAGVLTITGSNDADQIQVVFDQPNNQIVVLDADRETGRFLSNAVNNLIINALDGDDTIRIDAAIAQPAALNGGNGNDKLDSGGGNSLLTGNNGKDKFFSVNATADPNFPQPRMDVNADAVDPDRVFDAAPSSDQIQLTPEEVQALLQRASAATPSRDAIIAIVDRNGRILGVLVEDGVSPAITGDNNQRVFAVDGAVAKARTGAFFSNNAAPLTSRTVRFISQSTITEREVNSNPNAPLDSPTFGPGFVAPIGLGSHFPPDVSFTPQVDLFGIEHTNRDSLVHAGADGSKASAGDNINLPARFNINPANIPAGVNLFTPESFGVVSGLNLNAQARGIATLPGGIPIFKQGALVGGIGVFFPGETGFASEENSALSADYDPTKTDRSLEAEFIAFAALGGSSGAQATFGTLGGVPAVPNFDLPFGRIDLVGITLDIYGPGGAQGVRRLVDFGLQLGTGTVQGAATLFNGGTGIAVPSGWLVNPTAGVNLSAEDVRQIIEQGINEAEQVRAAIRLPLDSRTNMIFAVTDVDGSVLGLYRMPDATFFSIDVAVAKARNVSYYADPAQLDALDQLTGVGAGTAFTNRTFRYLALPRFPEGIDGAPPGPFSSLNDPNIDPRTGLNSGPALTADNYQSVLLRDSFFPHSNFRDETNIANQNGIVFFPGSAPLYKDLDGDGRRELVGGFGVSGDGVDQDDVVTGSGAAGFEPVGIPRADQATFNTIRLPYQKFNRNPRG